MELCQSDECWLVLLYVWTNDPFEPFPIQVVGQILGDQNTEVLARPVVVLLANNLQTG